MLQPRQVKLVRMFTPALFDAPQYGTCTRIHVAGGSTHAPDWATLAECASACADGFVYIDRFSAIELRGITDAEALKRRLQGLHLHAATVPVLRFYTRYDIEDGFDFGDVLVSTDQFTETGPSPVEFTDNTQRMLRVTGTNTTWREIVIPLTAYAGEPDVRIMFRLVTDSSFSQDGWMIDDVEIFERNPEADSAAPSVPAGLVAEGRTPQTIRLTWTAPGDDNTQGLAARYDVRYAMADILNEAAFDAATPVAFTPDPLPAGTVQQLDIPGLLPDTTWFFAVRAIDDNGNRSGFVTASSMTRYDVTIFSDDMETGTSNWSADSPWALTTATANSPASSWTDSPSGDYSSNVDVALTSTPLDLTGVFDSTLVFAQRYDLEDGFDAGAVEASTDGFATFETIASFSGTRVSWHRVSADLSGFDGQTGVQIRFRLLSDDLVQADGWYIDDVRVLANQTQAPTGPVVDMTGLALTGTVTNGIVTTVDVYVDAAFSGSTTVVGGLWSYDIPTLPTGPSTITLEAIDSMLNVGKRTLAIQK